MTDPKLQPDQDLMRTAYHEAGHVIAYLHMGHPFEYVTIIPSDPDHHLGATHGIHGSASLRTRGIGGAAGPAAEVFFMYVAEDPAGDYDALDRMRAVAQTLNAALDTGDDSELKEAENDFPDAIEEAAALVAGRWSSIVAVADALLEHGTLTVEQCLDVANGAVADL